MENSKIEWTEHTFNPWMGCTKVSPACDNCYAEKLVTGRMGKDVWGAGKPRALTSISNWNQPLKWNREAEKAGKRARVFCASLADVFDNEVPQEWRHRLYDLILATPHLDWLLLTKRIGNAKKFLPADWLVEPRPNIWIGATIANQEEADRDIPKLLEVPAVIRFLSMEPLLGPVNLRPLRLEQNGERVSIYPLEGAFQIPSSHYNVMHPRIHWVIVGGESGPGARPTMTAKMVRSLRDQCEGAGTPFLFKQWGDWAPYDRGQVDTTTLVSPGAFDEPMQKFGKKAAGRMIDGRTHDGVPRSAA